MSWTRTEQARAAAMAMMAVTTLTLGLLPLARAESFITKMLAPFLDLKTLTAGEGPEFAKLVADAGMEMRTGEARLPGWAANGSFTPVDERYLVGSGEMAALLDLYRKCRTRDSWALQTWCVGDLDVFASDTDRLTMCPPGVRTHPCSGRVLPGTWDQDVPFEPRSMAKFLWPWEGVKCEAYADPTTVTHIYLPGEALQCQLEELNLGRMRSLEQLDLSDNMLHGPFPAWLNGRMNTLRFFNLSHNQINGTLLKPLGDCDRIEVLDLSYNRLTAMTLATFGSMRRLRHVNLAHNPLNTKLPARSFQGDALNYMNLSHCGLYGDFPDLPAFRHLVTMDLSHNNLTGSLPASLTLLGRHNLEDPDEEPVIEIIDISHNKLTGSLPELWNSTSLRVLAVNDNDFSGRIPDLPPKVAFNPESAAAMFSNNGRFWCSMPDALAKSDLPCICGGGHAPLTNQSRVDDDGDAGVALHASRMALIPAKNASALCARCPSGTYSNETTGYRCATCPAGWMPVSSVQSQLPAFLWEAQYAELKTRIMDKCGRCPPGSFAGSVGDSNAAECQLCPPGSANSQVGRFKCDPCPPGHFSSALGALACSPCTPGTFSDVEGSKACSPCPAGTFSRWAAHANNTGIAECLPCARGFYQEVRGAPKCLACPNGTVARLPGMTKCFPCQPGSFFDAESKSCSPCRPGSFSAQEGASACERCPSGTTTEVLGGTECLPTAPPGRGAIAAGQRADLPNSTRACVPGTFNDGLFLSCQACSRGYYAAASGARKCAPCPVGSYAPTLGGSKCLAAPVGFFVDEQAAWKPKRCAAGEFGRSAGSSRCERCPDGSFALFGGEGRCETPRDGETLQRVEWPRVRMTLLGMTLADFHSRFASREGESAAAANSTGGMDSSPAAKAVADAVRVALNLFTVADVKVHVLDVDRASAVEATADLAVELVVEEVPLRLPKRGKQEDASWVEQFKDAASRALHPDEVSKEQHQQEEKPATSTSAGGLVSRFFGGLFDPDGEDQPKKESEGASLKDTISSVAFRDEVARNLGRQDALKRSVPLGLLRLELLGAHATWRATRAVPCPPGSFFSKGNRSCELCAPGSYSSGSGALSCSLCPRGTFADDAGMETCERCKFTEDAREGSAACVYCEWFTRECSDFAEHVAITVALALALALKLLQRARAMLFGDRRALQRSEDTVLLASVRVYGRAPGGPRYAAMGPVSASTLWSPPPPEADRTRSAGGNGAPTARATERVDVPTGATGAGF